MGDAAAARPATAGEAEARQRARGRLLVGDLAGAVAALGESPAEPETRCLAARVAADAALRQGDPAAARDGLVAALRDVAPGPEAAIAAACLAEVSANAGDSAAASAAAEKAAALAAACGDAAAGAWAALARGLATAGAAGDEALMKAVAAAEASGEEEAAFRAHHAIGARAARAGGGPTAQAGFDRALAVLRRLFSQCAPADRPQFLETPARRRFSAELLRLAAGDGVVRASGGAARRVEARLQGEEDLAAFEKLTPAIAGDTRLEPVLGRLRDRFRDLLRLQEIGMALTAELDVERLLALIMDRAIEISGAERGFLLLLDNGRTTVAAARNVDQENVQRPEWKVSHSLAAEVARSGSPIIASDARADERFAAYGSVHDLGLRSILCVPLRVMGRILGTLYLDNRFRDGAFGPGSVAVVQAFADHAALALDNARLHREAQEARREVEALNKRLSDLNRDLKATVESQSVELDRARLELRETRRATPARYGGLVGRAPAMLEVFRLIDRIAETDAPVLIEGQSGSGKELAARAIHDHGARRDRPFVPENCGAVPQTLFESVFFGHVRGAFTGATKDAPGLFVLADGGTLFLDEISGMDAEMQKKLLRVLQEGEVRPVGGSAARKVDVRIIAAGNQPLAELVRAGKFREDLFFRLNVLQLRLPPLRERATDVPLLVAHFLGIEERALADRVTPGVLDLLQRYAWPGNVRELENVVARMGALGRGILDESLLPEEIRRAQAPLAAPRALFGAKSLDALEEEVIAGAIRDALRQAEGVKARAAQLLGIPKSSLYNKMKRYNIEG